MLVRIGLFVLATGALFASSASAQIWDGTADVIHTDIKAPNGEVLGHGSFSLQTLGTELSSNFREAWEWDNVAWPDADFYLDPGVTAADLDKSIFYDNLVFDDGVTATPPSSLGSNERLYRVELCGSGGVCDVAAYVIVELTDYDLEWFKAPGLGTHDRIPLTSNRTLRFYVMSTPPASSGSVPYIDNPAL